jgi:transposase InsO family protein
MDEDDIAAPRSAGSERSLNRAGHCSDYAALESVGSTLKSDTDVAQAIPVSRHHAELAVFDYIETF